MFAAFFAAGSARAEESGEALRKAIRAGDVAAVQRLLAAGADVNAASETGRTPLYRAALSGRTEVVRVLLAAGADVNAATTSGRTPLHIAISMRRNEVVRVLLDKGANVNAAIKGGVKDGQTPLHLAASDGLADVVRVLLEKGANPNAADKEGWTPLQLAVLEDHADAVRALLDKGANINATFGTSRRTPLDMAEENRAIYGKYIRGAYEETVALLQARGGKANNRSESYAASVMFPTEGAGRLYASAECNKVEMLRSLLSQGVSANARSTDSREVYEGGTALHGAVIGYLYDSLLLSGGKIDDTDGARKRAIDERALAKSTRDLALSTKALFLARQIAEEAVAEINRDRAKAEEMQKKADMYPLRYFCWPEWEPPLDASVKALLAAGADVNATDGKGRTPLALLRELVKNPKVKDNPEVDKLVQLLKAAGARE